MKGHVACVKGTDNAYKILIRKPEGKRPLEGERDRLEDDIKMDNNWTGDSGILS
jgi:hypothetical protein